MNKLFQILLAFCMVALSELTFAACLPNINAAANCRYEQRDAWCAEHGKGNPFAFHDDCLKDASLSSTSSEATLPNDKRWIIIASRESIQEAKAIAASYQSDFKKTAVFSSKNGHYAVTIGDKTYPEAKNVLGKLIASGKIPDDSFLATGHNLYHISSTEAKKPVPLFFIGSGRSAEPFGIAQSQSKDIKDFDMWHDTKAGVKVDAKLVTLGQTLHVYSESSFIGSTTIIRIDIYDSGSCDQSEDSIMLSNPNLLPEDKESILSTVPLQQRHRPPQHELTAEEKTTANMLVDELLKQKGFAPSISVGLQKILRLRRSIFVIKMVMPW